jgi:D-glycero-beta-D-manno-heptose 1-phosphate adenylyltransferase
MISLTDKELQIKNNNKNPSDKKYIDYKNKICKKPWGYEFLIFMNNKIGIWFLNIKKNQQTSLHTHFNKDTLLFLYKGVGLVTFIDGNTKILNELDYIYIPKYKFHQISSLIENSYFIEIEIFDNTTSYSDKNDLLRINDIYNRDNTGYESSINIFEGSGNLNLYEYFYLDGDLCINYLDNIIEFKTLNNINDINYNKINILIEGELYLDNHIIKEGSIINYNENLIIISENIKILSLYSEYKTENAKIIYNLDHLDKLVSNKILCSNKNKLILTSGCFDILHIGHLNILKKAKNLGDLLIVCLSNDEQITKLKGPTRPINNYCDRINLFKTISYVDYIILYNEEDINKEKTLDTIMKIIDPTIWVKGSDYTKEKILSLHPHLKKIELIDLVKDKSTSNIVKKISNKD